MVQEVFCFIADIFGYMTARILVPLLSFGRVRVENITEVEWGYNLLGLRREADGTWLMDCILAGWLGLFFWIAVSVAAIALLRPF